MQSVRPMYLWRNIGRRLHQSNIYSYYMHHSEQIFVPSIREFFGIGIHKKRCLGGIPEFIPIYRQGEVSVPAARRSSMETECHGRWSGATVWRWSAVTNEDEVQQRIIEQKCGSSNRIDATKWDCSVFLLLIHPMVPIKREMCCIFTLWVSLRRAVAVTKR